MQIAKLVDAADGEGPFFLVSDANDDHHDDYGAQLSAKTWRNQCPEDVWLREETRGGESGVRLTDRGCALTQNRGGMQGHDMGFVDVSFAPWMIRFSRVLGPYRGWPAPSDDSRFGKWLRAVEENDAVKKTTSDDELYLDSYERYAGMHHLPTMYCFGWWRGGKGPESWKMDPTNAALDPG